MNLIRAFRVLLLKSVTTVRRVFFRQSAGRRAAMGRQRPAARRPGLGVRCAARSVHHLSAAAPEAGAGPTS